MKKNFKTLLVLMTGVLFLTFATIPETSFLQQAKQKVQQAEGRAIWFH